MSRAKRNTRAARRSFDPSIKRSIGLIVGVVVIGAIGLSWIEGWDLWQSLYFTLVTVTTVGYSDYGLSVAGQRFAVFLMVCGIGAMSCAMTQLLGRIMVMSLHPEANVLKQIQKLKGHHIVCGAGRMGRHVINRLLEDGETCVALDIDPKAVEHLREAGVLVLEEDGSSDAGLLRAGLDRAASVAAVTDSDATNAMICLTAHSYVPDLPVIARAEDEASRRKLIRAGATRVVNTTSFGGDGIFESMLRPHAAELMIGGAAGRHALSFADIEISSGSAFLGRKLLDFGVAFPRLIIVAGRNADGDLELRPSVDAQLCEGEVIVVCGAYMDLEAASEQSATQRNKAA